MHQNNHFESTNWWYSNVVTVWGTDACELTFVCSINGKPLQILGQIYFSPWCYVAHLEDGMGL
jgi:hypothetical protein